jgi:hypothetical protein|tara:strand:- start:307 stop:834 length:528 start_codon:yes stop_codon:yes gene_type:complete
MKQEQAQKRIEELRGYYAHLASFVGVNLFLFMINMMTSSSEIWFVYPMFGWGIGLFIHTFLTFTSGHDWEERKMQELTGLSMTQEELQRLSERTESLVTILSSVNWDKIDPDLLETKENLLDAREKILELQEHGYSSEDGVNKEDVIQEIEKLEEFVTSPRFQFYDQAQSSNDPK